jgi:hypothetical protein
MNVIRARARYDGAEREVYTRVAEVDGRVYLDLCNKAWEVVEITSSGWRILEQSPVHFQRRAGMLALPQPETGGSVTELQEYVNVTRDEDFPLVVSWELAALRGRGPYPVLNIMGEAGSAKSSLMRLLRSCVDPNEADLRGPPTNDRDLFIAANNGYIGSFDNLSELRPWLSDSLCRLSTGGGFGTRKLFTDEDEVLFNIMRPIVFTAIENIVNRSDLADRSIGLNLYPIPEHKRRREHELWDAFNRDRPPILGALLDAVAHGLGALPHVKLERYPRMADFAEWGTACEGSLWTPGTFLHAYSANQVKATVDVIDADLVAKTVRRFVEEQGGAWRGETDELLMNLNSMITEHQHKDRSWPKATNSLSAKLTRAATALRKVGVEIDSRPDKRTNRKIWTIILVPDECRSAG